MAAALPVHSSEARIVRVIANVSRVVVCLNWVSILGILVSHNVPKDFALGVFTVFKITAIAAALWLLAEVAEGFAGRIKFVAIVGDCFLILPMFAFWFLVTASTY
jgi:hypothetical protein